MTTLSPASRYSWIGAALGLGAPAGFAALRRVLSGRGRQGLADRGLPYGYMASATPLVFWLFGRVLGRHEERLRASQEDLERLREEFVAVVAHDLRDPIQVILLQLDVLMQDARDGQVTVPVSTLHRLHRGAMRLAQMVNDLLDAGRVDASRLHVVPRAISLPDVAKALIERIGPTLGAHPIDTLVEQEALLVKADPARLDQILTNLIGNAAKYSEEGASISVRIRASAGGAEVSVSDQGPGIAPDELPRPFDRYYQSKRARERKDGLGLGLYIAKGLVEAHHGRIEVESTLGRGSTFTVWLPSAETS